MKDCKQWKDHCKARDKNPKWQKKRANELKSKKHERDALENVESSAMKAHDSYDSDESFIDPEDIVDDLPIEIIK